MIILPKETCAIMFDLGGVIMDLDIDLSKHALGALGFEERMFHLQDTGNNLFIDLEVGRLDTKQFYILLRRILGKPVEDDVLEQAWNKMIRGFQPEKIDLLRKMKNTYELYLLSNTNEIHVNRCNEILREKYNITGLDALFSQTFFSHTLGLRKPQPEIFSYVLEQVGYPPDKIVYIDDTKEHIETASSMGFHCFLHNRNAPLKFAEND